MKSPGIFRRAINSLQNHFFLRNLVFAVCIGIVAVYLTGQLLKAYTRHGQKYEVPDFEEITVVEALHLAAPAKLRLEVIDSLYIPQKRPGAIVDQSPKPGMNVKSGRRVFLTVNAYRPRMEVIPCVTGNSLRQAKNMLESKGFQIERLVFRDDIATLYVLDQSWEGKKIVPGSDIKAEIGSGIALIVGRNYSDQNPIVPKVINLTLREAKSRLWEVGLNVGEIRRDNTVTDDNADNAKVYRQSPNQQARPAFGTKVDLWLTTNAETVVKSSRESDAAARPEPANIDSSGVGSDENIPSEEDMLRAFGIE